MKLVNCLIAKFNKLKYRSPEPQLFIISHPKCGRTWLRAMIGKYLLIRNAIPDKCLFETEYVTNKSGLSCTTFYHDIASFSPRVHYQQVPHIVQDYATKKIILLARDIKDTLVSSYFQASRRRALYSGTLSKFIRDDAFGINKMLTCYDIWLKTLPSSQAFLYLQYEDIHNDPEKVLSNVLMFLGESEIDNNVVQRSVKYCSFTTLRKLELNNNFRSSALSPPPKNDPESYKVRKGKVGGYRSYLSEVDVIYIEEGISKYNIDFSKFRRFGRFGLDL